MRMMRDKLEAAECSHYGYVVDGLPALAGPLFDARSQLDILRAARLQPDFLIHIRVRLSFMLICLCYSGGSGLGCGSGSGSGSGCWGFNVSPVSLVNLRVSILTLLVALAQALVLGVQAVIFVRVRPTHPRWIFLLSCPTVENPSSHPSSRPPSKMSVFLFIALSKLKNCKLHQNMMKELYHAMHFLIYCV